MKATMGKCEGLGGWSGQPEFLSGSAEQMPVPVDGSLGAAERDAERYLSHSCIHVGHKLGPQALFLCLK